MDELERDILLIVMIGDASFRTDEKAVCGVLLLFTDNYISAILEQQADRE